jgi:hypothetical protein
MKYRRKFQQLEKERNEKDKENNASRTGAEVE